MSPLNCRLLAIKLILLVITDSTIYGFSLHRGRDKSEKFPAVDLFADESTLLEVKNELKRPNDIKLFELTKEGNSEKNAATDKNKNNLEKSTTTEHLKEAVTKLNDRNLNASKESTKPTLMRSELLTRYNENLPFLSTITNTGTTPLEFNTKSNQNLLISSTIDSTPNLTTLNPNINLAQTTTKNISKPYDFTIVENHDTTTSDGVTNPFFISKDLIHDINELSSTVDMEAYTSDAVTLNDISNISDANVHSTLIDEQVTVSEQTKLPTTSTKKYLTIERQKTTSSEVTNNDGNKPMTSTSLTKIAISTSMTPTELSKPEFSRIGENTTSFEKETRKSNQISSLKPEFKIGTVSSMRAGYLDYSGKATTQPTTTQKIKVTENVEKPIEIVHKNASAVQSLGQLSEDVINEQLLKEEVIKDNAENDRIRDFTSSNEGVKPLAEYARTTKRTPINDTNQEPVTEGFNVQPITHEPSKNDLYTVNPNYKPMKRLEVQPAKPFVRDPDDNSWRNESISSLGIVFKPKNSSKSFTQVLKNKTETVLNSLGERDSKGGIPDLRERLEKIAEVRKSKKKRINKFGDTVYTDYEERDIYNEASNKSRLNLFNSKLYTPNATIQKPNEKGNSSVAKSQQGIVDTNTGKPNSYNIAEYYDTTDEYDADYLTLTKLDIKKHPVPTKETYTDTPITYTSGYYFPDRRPTVQYFPPRVAPKINDRNIFHSKINSFTVKDPESVVPLGTVATPPQTNNQDAIKPTSYQSDLNKNVYLTESGRQPQQHGEFGGSDGHFNRASYVVKHYGDFINEAARADDDRQGDYVVITEQPVHGVTVNELAKLTTDRQKPNLDSEYDYDAKYRTDLINRFVSNFNQNSERFKVDFPIIYNNSVVHKKLDENGRVLASSTAFMKRLYDDLTATKPEFGLVKKPCEPHCENVTVELSPAYELHYYVPDEEEKLPIESKPSPYRFRL